MDKDLLRELYGDTYWNASIQPFGLWSTHPHCAMNRMRFGDDRPQRQLPFDTLQRKANLGNLLEIVDLRPTSKVQEPSLEGGVRWSEAVRESACRPGLRAGWNASRRCHCDENRLIVNCHTGRRSRPVR